MEIIIILGLIFGAFSAAIANSKNKEAIVWFVLGFLFGPIALIAVGLMPKEEHQKEVIKPRKDPAQVREQLAKMRG